MSTFSDRLLKWWDVNGRKDLPWQHPRTPYRVWLAEIMLQQTQVKTVIPYYESFLKQFPDISSLAAATQDDVMAQWSGLGYYARARNLHKTAQICVEQHHSDLPQTPEALLKLPGIGESTANAIYSQSSDQPATVLDGNVKRVLSRHMAVEGWPGTAKIQKQLWTAATKLLPEQRGADYTQAIMDLGATLCTRSSPACQSCPVSADCKAYAAGTVQNFPASKPKAKIKQKTFYMLLNIVEGQVLLERRPPAGIWGGLWVLPADEDLGSLLSRFNISSSDAKALPELQHQLTHMQMTIHPFINSTKPFAKGVECNSEQNWFSKQQWPELGLPKPVRQLLETYL